MIRPVRNREDIRFEKQRLADRQKLLEGSLANAWKNMCNSLKPGNLVKLAARAFIRK